jgi:aspartate racemase
MKKYVRKLGILGGMGPEATASLYLNIINRCQAELGAKYNSDFPPIIINSCPVPDGRMWEGFSKTRVEKFLRTNVKILEKAGVDFVAVPCNSVHYFYPVIQKAVSIPVLSIVEETAKEIRRKSLTRVLLLATEFTARSGIYDGPLADCGITLVKPDPGQQRVVQKIIVNTESGQRLESDRAAVASIVSELKKKKGIEGVIAGCTEIPLLVRQKHLPVTLFDTIGILAASAYALILGRSSFVRIRSASSDRRLRQAGRSTLGRGRSSLRRSL